MVCIIFKTKKYATILCACFTKLKSMHNGLMDCWKYFYAGQSLKALYNVVDKTNANDDYNG